MSAGILITTPSPRRPRGSCPSADSARLPSNAREPSVAPNRERVTGWPGLPLLVHRAQHGAHPGELVAIEVGGDNAGTTAIRLKSVPAAPATEVEQALARGDLELTEVDCQHAGSG